MFAHRSFFFLRLTARYTLLPFYYSVTFTRPSRIVVLFFLLAAWLLFLLARRSPLSACYTLLDACCSLFPDSLLTLVARWLLYANRGLLPADGIPLLVSRNLLPRLLQSAWYLLYAARLLHIIGTCSPLTPFSLMLAVPLKRSAVFHPHNAFQCSVPVSRCSLLAAQFSCLVACCSPLFSFLLFVVRYSLLYTRCWPRTD